MTPWSAVVSLGGYLVDYFKGRTEQKKAAKVAQAKLELAKDLTDQKIELSHSEWEALSVSKQDSTWKDEYATVVITWPFIGIMLGTLIVAFGGERSMLDGTLDGVKELKALGIDMGMLMTIVISAAVSIKAVDRIKRK